MWALQYDNAGKRLISASPDHTSRIWDVKSGKCADVLKAHTHFVSIVLFLNHDIPQPKFTNLALYFINIVFQSSLLA